MENVNLQYQVFFLSDVQANINKNISFKDEVNSKIELFKNYEFGKIDNPLDIRENLTSIANLSGYLAGIYNTSLGDILIQGEFVNIYPFEHENPIKLYLIITVAMYVKN